MHSCVAELHECTGNGHGVIHGQTRLFRKPTTRSHGWDAYDPEARSFESWDGFRVRRVRAAVAVGMKVQHAVLVAVDMDVDPVAPEPVRELGA